MNAELTANYDVSDDQKARTGGLPLVIRGALNEGHLLRGRMGGLRMT